MQLILEYAPIILFFVAYQIKGIFFATAVAIAASIATIVYCAISKRKISPIQWMSVGIITVFGGLTLLLQDERFIKAKPTVLYCSFAAALLIGKYVYKKHWIAALFASANIEAPEHAWSRFTWAWIVFFLALAGLNWYVAQTSTLDQWVRFKTLWTGLIVAAFSVLSFLLFLAKHMDLGADTEPPKEKNDERR
jgi:intracellular septation protein